MDYDFLDKFIDDCGDEFGHGAGRPGGSGPSGIRDLPCGRTDHAGEQRVLPLRRQPAGVDPLDHPVHTTGDGDHRLGNRQGTCGKERDHCQHRGSGSEPAPGSPGR